MIRETRSAAVQGAFMVVGVFAALMHSCVQAQTNSSTSIGLDPLTEKTLIAVVSAVLSLITGYILLQLKERREPKKRLSYDLEMRHGLIAVEESISRNVSLNYKGQPADKLTYVRCDIKNTGNSVVKAEFIRFEFGHGSRILDAYMDPPPPREYGVSEVSDGDVIQHERRYRISHLEKQQKVGFRFVLSDAPETEPTIIPFNDEGDVEVAAASITRAADDRRLVEQFMYLFILSLIVPPVFRLLPGILRDGALVLVYGILAVAMLPLLRPVSRSIAGAIAALGRAPEPTVSIGHLNQQPGSALSIASGRSVANATVENETESEAAPSSQSA